MNMFRNLVSRIVWTSADEGAGGGDGATPPAGSSPAGAADANPFGSLEGATPPAATPPATTPGSPYFPDKFPDHLRGQTDKETIDKLFGAFSGFRDEAAKRGAVPKEPAEYKLALRDDLTKVFGDPEKDPLVPIFRTMAHKHGLTDKQAAGFFEDFHAEVLAQGKVKTVDPMAEARALVGDQAARMTPQEIAAEATKQWKATVDWIDGLTGAKVLSTEQSAKLKAIAEDADGVKAINALRVLTREQGLQPGGDGSRGLTVDDLNARLADPRNDPFHPSHQPAFYAETQRLFQTFYGQAGRA
jgi:hypothetical protein